MRSIGGSNMWGGSQGVEARAADVLQVVPSRIRNGIPLLVVGNFLSATNSTRGICEDLSDRLEARKWKVSRASSQPQPFRRLIDMLGRVWVERRDYEVATIDVYSGRAFFWAMAVSLLLRRLGKKQVMALRGGALPEFARTHGRLVGAVLRSADAVVTPSEYLAREMSEYRKDILVVPNAIDVSRYMFRLRSQAAPKLCWLRAFHTIYNPELAVHVCWRLMGEFSDTTLVMYGPNKRDGSFDRTFDQCERFGLREQVTMPGGISKEEVPGALRQSDIFLNTTNYESFGVGVLEAMACGLCVVSTNVGGLPYLLEHEVDALLVPPNDADAMAAAVRRLLKEPGLAERLSANARRKAEKFDWSVILPRWESLLAGLVNG